MGPQGGYRAAPLQEPRITCTVALSPCAICCNTRGERIAFFPSPDCRAGRLTTWRKGNLQLARWPRDSRRKIRPCPTVQVRSQSCKSQPEVAFPDPAWDGRDGPRGVGITAAPHLAQGAWGGGGTGASCGGAGGGRAAADTNQPNPSAHGPWKRPPAKAAAASLAGAAASAAFPPRGRRQRRAPRLSAELVLPRRRVPHAWLWPAWIWHLPSEHPTCILPA